MPFERDILLAIHDRSTPALDAIFLFSHELGTVPFCVALVAAVALAHLIRGQRREAVLWILIGISVWVLQVGLKELFMRPRPALWETVHDYRSYAFPSGHALSAATFWPLLARSASRALPHFRPLFWTLAILMALYVGFGRLYLGVHWPTDVIAGWSLGAAQTAFGVWIVDKKLARSEDVIEP